MFTKGGHTAAAGTYWNMENGSRIDLHVEGILPGGNETMYLKAPSVAMLAAGPVLGLVFAVFLPMIAIVMALALVIRKLGEGVREAAAASMTFAWRPIESYLTGRKQKKAAREQKEEKKS